MGLMTPHNFITRCRDIVEAYDSFDTPEAYLVCEDLLDVARQYQAYKDEDVLLNYGQQKPCDNQSGEGS